MSKQEKQAFFIPDDEGEESEELAEDGGEDPGFDLGDDDGTIQEDGEDDDLNVTTKHPFSTPLHTADGSSSHSIDGAGGAWDVDQDGIAELATNYFVHNVSHAMSMLEEEKRANDELMEALEHSLVEGPAFGDVDFPLAPGGGFTAKRRKSDADVFGPFADDVGGVRATVLSSLQLLNSALEGKGARQTNTSDISVEYPQTSIFVSQVDDKMFSHVGKKLRMDLDADFPLGIDVEFEDTCKSGEGALSGSAKYLQLFKSEREKFDSVLTKFGI